MKISAVASSFLILAAVLGCPAHGSPAHGSLAREPEMALQLLEHLNTIQGFHQASDCCHSFTRRTIRCGLMRDYFLTTSGCSQPAFIFITKKGQRVCVDPNDKIVKDCMIKLNKKNLPTESFLV